MQFPFERSTILFGGVLQLLAPCGSAVAQDVYDPFPVLVEQESGTSTLLQAVSPVDELVVWVSGHRGTFVRTLDGGDTWESGVVLDADTLQFRDVHAVDASTAYLLSAGPGQLSRIYKTTDGGRNWILQFTNDHPTGFFDCMDFWSPDRGIAFSDAVEGRLVIVRTSDGGRTWTPIRRDGIPLALAGEGGFAASGTCLVTAGEQLAWIGTGAGGEARVYRTKDGGDSWTVASTPIVGGTYTSGVMALAVRDGREGIAAGGELRDTDGHRDNVAVTADGGRTWTLAGRPVITGAVYGIAYVPGARTPTVVAVGPKGADYSIDDGATWENLSRNAYWSVGFTTQVVGWMVGPGGRITKIAFRDSREEI
jgi:photosystem II stability/assembly factor-like uncharacterized protein